MFTDLNEFLKANAKANGAEDRRVYTYGKMNFSIGSFGYTYLINGKAEVGDIAIVNSKEGKRLTLISKITYGLKSEAPYDFDKLVEPAEIVKYGTERHRKLLTEMFAHGNDYRDPDEPQDESEDEFDDSEEYLMEMDYRESEGI